MYNFEELTTGEAKDLLRQWREKNERRSEDIMEVWLSVLSEDLDNIGSDKHVILEQVLYAALDCHQYGVARACILILSKEFPGSLKVMRYKAAILEAEEKYDEALQMLDNILNADETNSSARKRRIAILKAQGQLPEAIKELVDYLKKFMADMEAWQELCELYLMAQDPARAAYCAEELLLHQPHSHLMHQRLADIRYTMGGVENMELAKTYYCQALKLNPDNMRALLGLFMVTNNLLIHYKSSGNSGKRKEVWRLCQWAQSGVARAHSRAPAPDLTQAMLALAITD